MKDGPWSFRDLLVSNASVVMVGNSRGRDINAACGQLRVARLA